MAWQWAAVLSSAVIATVVGVAVEIRRQREEEREATQQHQDLGGSRKKACQQAKQPFHKVCGRGRRRR
jgi:hypothetical protein